MLNPGGNPYVVGTSGQVFDSREAPQTEALLQIASEIVMGIFASYSEGGTIANLAALDNVPIQKQLSVHTVTDRADVAAVDVSGTAHCTVEAPGALDLLGDSCTIRLERTHTAPSALIYARVAGLNASVELQIWQPAHVEIGLSSRRLLRIQGVPAVCSPGATTVGSVASPSERFQRARVSLLVDGFDATPLVGGFALSTPQIGAVHFDSNSRAHWLQPVQPGTTRAFVAQFADGPGAVVNVVDSTVELVGLRARIITGARWRNAPPASTLPASATVAFAAEVELQQVLEFEGDAGWVHVDAQFSDGTSDEISPAQLTVEAISASVQPLAPSPASGEPTWRVAVATGAVSECGGMARVHWTPCGASVANTTTPAKLALPTPSRLVLTLAVDRLTSPDDAAVLPPLSVATSASAQLIVGFGESPQSIHAHETLVSARGVRSQVVGP